MALLLTPPAELILRPDGRGNYLLDTYDRPLSWDLRLGHPFLQVSEDSGWVQRVLIAWRSMVGDTFPLFFSTTTTTWLLFPIWLTLGGGLSRLSLQHCVSLITFWLGVGGGSHSLLTISSACSETSGLLITF